MHASTTPNEFRVYKHLAYIQNIIVRILTVLRQPSSVFTRPIIVMQFAKVRFAWCAWSTSHSSVTASDVNIKRFYTRRNGYTQHCPDEHTENFANSLLLRKKKILMHVKDVHSAYVESVYGTTWTGESYTHAVQQKNCLIAGTLFCWFAITFLSTRTFTREAMIIKPLMPDCCQWLPDGSDKSTCKNG